MPASQLGADLLLTPGTTISGYTVVSRNISTVSDNEEKKDENGALKVRITYSALEQIQLVLEPETAKDESAIKADFPINAKTTITGLTTYTVTDRSIDRSSGPAQVNVTLLADGLT
jgi:hypothetical protein